MTTPCSLCFGWSNVILPSPPTSYTSYLFGYCNPWAGMALRILWSMMVGAGTWALDQYTHRSNSKLVLCVWDVVYIKKVQDLGMPLDIVECGWHDSELWSLRKGCHLYRIWIIVLSNCKFCERTSLVNCMLNWTRKPASDDARGASMQRRFDFPTIHSPFCSSIFQTAASKY